jgi:hypothetical protein
VAWVLLAVALGLMLFARLPTLVSLLLGTGLGVALVLLVRPIHSPRRPASVHSDGRVRARWV